MREPGFVLSAKCAIKTAVLLPITLWFSVSFATSTLEVIPLKHRPAEMLVSSIKEVAHPDIAISAAGNQLILRGEPEEISMLRSLIDELDQPLEQYTIHVRQNNQKSSYEKNTQAGYTYQSGDDGSGSNIKIGKITLDGKPVPRSGATVISKSGNHTATVTSRTYSTSTSSNTNQKINALEGHSARIETGKEIPFLSWDRYDGVVTKEYRPVVTGFYVTPHPSGNDRVTLDIATQKQKVQENTRDHIEVAGYQSSINARLGEWINVGASLQSGNNRNREIGKRYSVNSGDNYSIEIMVERKY